MFENFDKAYNSKINPLYIDSNENITCLKQKLLKHNINCIWLSFECTGEWCKDKHTIVVKKIPVVKRLTKESLMCRSCCTKTTNLKRYGVENVFQDKNVKEKIKQTNIEKLGVENPSQSDKIKHKKEQTCRKHFGVSSPLQSKKVMDKVVETNNKLYGCDYTCQNKDVREKQYETQRKHYNGKLYFETEESKEKARQTKLEKYGNENYVNEQKRIRTNNKRFGSDYYQQSEYYDDNKKKIMSRKRKKTLNQRYGKEYSIREDYVYKNIVFNSSWELAVYIWAKNHKKRIIKEPCCFIYKYNHKTYRYYPDFSIDNELIEIKGDQFLEFYKNGKIKNLKNPYSADKNEMYHQKFKCMQKHNVKIWSKKDLKPILSYIHKKYGRNYLNQFKKKK